MFLAVGGGRGKEIMILAVLAKAGMVKQHRAINIGDDKMITMVISALVAIRQTISITILILIKVR